MSQSIYLCVDAGQLYTWGFNEKGQLGLGHRFNCDAPRLVHTLHGVHLVGVACGAHHTVVLDGMVAIACLIINAKN